MANVTDYPAYYYEDGLADPPPSPACGPPPQLAGARFFLCAAYSLACGLGLLANMLLLGAAAVRPRRGERERPGPFVLGLAVADLTLVAPLPLWADATSRDGRWRFGEAACRLGAYLAGTGAYCSVLLLGLTSLERFLAVARPGAHTRLRPITRARLLCLGVWAVSLLLAAPVLGRRRLQERPGAAYCVEGELLAPGISLAYLTGTFLLPLGLVLACNCEVARRLRRGPRRRSRRLRRSSALVRAVAGAFATCWLPFRTLQAMELAARWGWGKEGVHCGLLWALSLGQQLSAPLAFASGFANPAVYFLWADWPRRTLAWLAGRYLPSEVSHASSSETQA